MEELRLSTVHLTDKPCWNCSSLLRKRCSFCSCLEVEPRTTENSAQCSSGSLLPILGTSISLKQLKKKVLIIKRGKRNWGVAEILQVLQLSRGRTKNSWKFVCLAVYHRLCRLLRSSFHGLSRRQKIQMAHTCEHIVYLCCTHTKMIRIMLNPTAELQTGFFFLIQPTGLLCLPSSIPLN